MPDYRLRIGMKFRQQGRLYVIEQTLPNDHLGIKDIVSGEVFAKPRGEFLAALFDGKLELIGDFDQNDVMSDRPADLYVIDLDLHAEDDLLRLELIRRSRYVNCVMEDAPDRCSKEDLTPPGRPWLTVMLDVNSRIVHGSHLSFDHPSYLSVMQCLRQVIKPKDYVRTLYPEIKNDWPAYGMPELLVVDKGKELYSVPS